MRNGSKLEKKAILEISTDISLFGRFRLAFSVLFHYQVDLKLSIFFFLRPSVFPLRLIQTMDNELFVAR